MAPRYYGLCVGRTRVDPATPEYHGWNGAGGCAGCKKDVGHVSTYLKRIGYVNTILTNKEATKTGVMAALASLSNKAHWNDRVVFYYSGHGGQAPDKNDDEAYDRLDETLALYDGQLLDNEIQEALCRFRSGVRVILVTDSCHLESNDREGPGPSVPRFFTVERATEGMQAGLIHLSGCRDGGVSLGYDQGGAFTLALMGVLNQRHFDGSLAALHDRICQRIDRIQEPQYSEYGPVPDEFRNWPAFR